MKAGRCNNVMKSPFRWLLAAAWYAAASVITVLILIVMVKAIKVLLQPDSPSLSVVPGCMLVRRLDMEPESKLESWFTVRVLVPRSGARIYFSNITAYLFGKDTPPSSTHPQDDSLVYFILGDIMLPPQQTYMEVTLTADMRRDANVIEVSFYDMLYSRSNNGISSDVTMRLDGTVSQVTSTSSYNRSTTYYCWPILVISGSGDEDTLMKYRSLVSRDVFCSEEQGKHLIL